MKPPNTRIPHPFPYQGSKRGVAQHILPHIPADAHRLIEPFCGSAAISLAAAASNRAHRFWLNDANAPLMALWAELLERPMDLAASYEDLWNRQLPDRKAFFFRIRDEFNQTHEPHLLLYLLARIVKGAVRYSGDGRFNQSPDNRRSGMRPKTMREQMLGVSALLADKTKLTAKDFRSVVAEASLDDVIYMDPPYQGTSFTRDHRYFGGVSYDEFVAALRHMNKREVSYIISYDGQTGGKQHGQPLPRHLSLHHLHIQAGRSSQLTLLGQACETVESLYLSPALVERLAGSASGRKAANKLPQSEAPVNATPAVEGTDPSAPAPGTPEARRPDTVELLLDSQRTEWQPPNWRPCRAGLPTRNFAGKNSRTNRRSAPLADLASGEQVHFPRNT